MARKKQSEITYDKGQKSDVTFKDFYAVYAAMEDFKHIPKFHYDLIDFLSAYGTWTNHTAVVQCFRNASKSSLVAAWVVWRLAVDPTLLFLIQSADDGTAAKMVGDVQKLITLHPFAEHLQSAKSTWTSKGVRVKGATSGRNLSVSARGIFSNVTGSRADIIIADDVEVPRNSEFQELRDRLRNRLSESSRLLNPNGLRLLIGTPHAHDSIYPEQIDKGASSFRVPLIDGIEGEFPNYTGTSNWPERWPIEMVARIQHECRTRAEFLSQYQLIAVNSEESHLDVSLIKRYSDEPEFIQSNGTKLYKINDKKITGINAFWDPSMSKSGGDSSVLAITFCTADGSIYIHRTIALQGEAEDQCKQARQVLIDFNVPIVYIETNGIGNFLPQILLKHTRGLGIGVDGKHTSIRKSDSIQGAYETPLSAGILYVHDSVMNTKFVTQLRDFNPRSMRGKDDFIDAPAKSIAQLPIAIGRGVTNTVSGFLPYRNFNTEISIERDYA
jgi:hypothetical protein